MGYCLLVEDQIVEEGGIIVFSDKSELKVVKIYPKTQRIGIFHKNTEETIGMPIKLLDDASIVKKDELTDPNILFKIRGAS